MASKSFKMVVWCPPNGPKTPVWLPAVINDIVAQFGGFMAADCGVPVHHVKLKKGSNEVVKQIKHPQFPSAVVKRASELYHFAEGSTPRGADPKRRGSTPHFEALHHAPLPPSSPSPSLFSLSLSLSCSTVSSHTLVCENSPLVVSTEVDKDKPVFTVSWAEEPTLHEVQPLFQTDALCPRLLRMLLPATPAEP